MWNLTKSMQEKTGGESAASVNTQPKREPLRRMLTTDCSSLFTNPIRPNRAGTRETVPSDPPKPPKLTTRTRSYVSSCGGPSAPDPDRAHIRRTLSASGPQPGTRSSFSKDTHLGSSATFRNMVPRSCSPVGVTVGVTVSSPSPTSGPNHLSLQPPPEITFDEVATVPGSPVTDQGSDRGSIGYRTSLNPFDCDGKKSSVTVEMSGVMTTGGNPRAVMVTPRGSLITLSQSPLEFSESTFTVNYDAETDDGDEVSLMYARHEKIPVKDFSAEIRASLDVENFLNQAQLLLDLQANSLEDIMDSMLHHLLDKDECPNAFFEAKKHLFTQDSVHQLAKTIQSTCRTYGGWFDYDQSWLCALCTVPSVQKRNVAIARLRNPANLGRTSQEVWFIVLVVTPTREKGTKNSLETGRTFATLFADMDLRMRLLTARTEHDFKLLLWEHMKELAEELVHPDRRMSPDALQLTDEVFEPNTFNTEVEKSGSCRVAVGIQTDLKRRLPHYLSDYKDGVSGHETLRKTVATVVFLYFACILPAIALGVLNYNNTKGYMDVKKVMYSQTIGGIFFAIFGGQPMVILLTTAPLALFTKVIYNICEDWELDFGAMFACTGLWNSAFLLTYSLTDASKVMRWSTRSTEEIFALFMSVTFTVDALKDVISDFRTNYYSPACYRSNKTEKSDGGDFSSAKETGNVDKANVSVLEEVLASFYDLDTNLSASVSSGEEEEPAGECLRQNSLLYLLLMLGTVWLSLSLYNFTKTPFLNANKRALLADCALPVSVLLMSLIGSYLFQEIKLEQFELIEGEIFVPAPLHKLSWPAILGSMGLGFSLSLLFFMDQSISGAMVNSAENRLKKGPAYHWDLFTVALLNAGLSFFGLPLLHGALPHSPLHVRAMADVEDRVDQGMVHQRIIFVRETRVTGIACHVLIGLSILSIDKLRLIPRPVLDGLFLYLAITALHQNQLFERIMLLVTEQAAYPPNHYIRTVPQRKVHLFTMIQLIQLFFLCSFGFAPVPYLKMVFPIMILLLLPVRHKLVPFLVDKKFLHSLDGH